MTPEHRKALHAMLDDAISRGATWSINIHPNTVDDEMSLLTQAAGRPHRGAKVEPRWTKVRFGNDDVTIFNEVTVFKGQKS